MLQSVDRKTRLTHIVAGDECAEKLPLTPGQVQRRHIIVVAPEWLESCLAKGLKVAEDNFQVHLEFCCDSGPLMLMLLHGATVRRQRDITNSVVSWNLIACTMPACPL